jgi:phosphoesterase RecJ-like protein
MKKLAARILGARRILLSTHKDPDGDGIGALLALARALRANGVQVEPLLPDDCPARFRFLDVDGLLRVLPKDADRISNDRPDLALILDTHQWALLGRVGELIQKDGIPTVFLDHHPVRDGGRTDVYGDCDVSSTGELVYRLLVDDLHLPIDTQIGECIYASIAFDTHSFRYVRNSPTPHLVAAELLARGVDAGRVYRHLFASNPVGKIRLLGRILSTVELQEEGRLAIAGLPLAWIREHDVCDDDLRDVVNHLLEVNGVEVAVMLREVDSNVIRISFRSKGRIEIHEAAQRLGGGGHPFAAGAALPGNLDTVRQLVLREVLPLLRSAPAHTE